MKSFFAQLIIVGSLATFSLYPQSNASAQPASHDLIRLMDSLAAVEEHPLLKKHFQTIAHFTADTTHGFQISGEDEAEAAKVLEFFRGEGAKWETYLNGPRPLMMSFQSKADGMYSYYWLFMPKDFAPGREDHPLYVELHGSGGGKNNNPRKMLYHPLQPELAGVTSQGFRREGFFVYPWGRGDKGYRDIAETDIFEVLADFDAMFPTDPKRQYLYGFSMGGAGTFRIAQRSMDRWAAVGMYSAALKDPSAEEAAAFRQMPVWMVWGEEEWLNEVNRQLKALFVDAGVDLKWKEIEGVGHNYLGEYQEDLMEWLKGHLKK